MFHENQIFVSFWVNFLVIFWQFVSILCIFFLVFGLLLVFVTFLSLFGCSRGHEPIFGLVKEVSFVFPRNASIALLLFCTRHVINQLKKPKFGFFAPLKSQAGSLWIVQFKQRESEKN